MTTLYSQLLATTDCSKIPAQANIYLLYTERTRVRERGGGALVVESAEVGGGWWWDQNKTTATKS
jgi:hypothetical protein